VRDALFSEGGGEERHFIIRFQATPACPLVGIM
jgi:hypothetical protein